jgi:hypothetical protein
MLPKKPLCGNEKLKRKKKSKEELIKSQQRTLEKFIFKMVDTQEVCVNVIILNERIFFYGLRPMKCQERHFQQCTKIA